MQEDLLKKKTVAISRRKKKHKEISGLEKLKGKEVNEITRREKGNGMCLSASKAKEHCNNTKDNKFGEQPMQTNSTRILNAASLM